MLKIRKPEGVLSRFYQIGCVLRISPIRLVHTKTGSWTFQLAGFNKIQLVMSGIGLVFGSSWTILLFSQIFGKNMDSGSIMFCIGMTAVYSHALFSQWFFLGNYKQCVPLFNAVFQMSIQRGKNS